MVNKWRLEKKEEQCKSAIQTELEKRKRWSVTLDVTDMFDHSGEPLPSIAFRVLTKKEDRDALVAAHAAAVTEARRAGEGAASCREDVDFLLDFKNVEALWRACRNPDNMDENAFITPEWMNETMDTDQLSCLLNLYLECRKRRGPLPYDIDEDRIEAVRTACVANFESDVPEIALATFDRQYLTTFMIMAMKMWHDERQAMLQRIEELEDVSEDNEHCCGCAEKS